MERPYRSVDWRGLPIKRPYPWERNMTICTAAICRDNHENKIVLCTDQKISTVVGSSDTARKEYGLGNDWHCLVSGSESEFLALVRLYRERFVNKANLTATTIDGSMKWPLNQRKAELCDQYTWGRFAVSYLDFMKTGKDQLPPEVFYEAVQHIKNIELDADLIICGFINSAAEIYHTDRRGSAKAAADFATVGEGEYLASSVLLRRKQHNYASLEETLYNVFEAKKFAESVGSVGQKTSISIISEGGRWQQTSLELDDQLAAAYRKYGPKDLPRAIKFDGDYYWKRG